eukprot:366508-Chlamydomonas_euryale.AAC.2
MTLSLAGRRFALRRLKVAAGERFPGWNGEGTFASTGGKSWGNGRSYRNKGCSHGEEEPSYGLSRGVLGWKRPPGGRVGVSQGREEKAYRGSEGLPGGKESCLGLKGELPRVARREGELPRVERRAA